MQKTKLTIEFITSQGGSRTVEALCDSAQFTEGCLMLLYETVDKPDRVKALPLITIRCADLEDIDTEEESYYDKA